MTQHEFMVLQLNENARHNRALEQIEEVKNNLNLKQLQFNVQNELAKRANERQQTQNTFNLGLLNAEETRRSNLRREGETTRHNTAVEFETARTNTANEIIAIGNREMQREHYLNMDITSLLGYQENVRHNTINELLQATGIANTYNSTMANIANQRYLGELSANTSLAAANISAASHVAAANISAAASRYASDNAYNSAIYSVDHQDARHDADIDIKQQQVDLDVQEALLDKNKFLIKNSEDVAWYQRTLTDPVAQWYQYFNADVKNNPVVRTLDELIGSINLFGGK